MWKLLKNFLQIHVLLCIPRTSNGMLTVNFSLQVKYPMWYTVCCIQIKIYWRVTLRFITAVEESSVSLDPLVPTWYKIDLNSGIFVLILSLALTYYKSVVYFPGATEQNNHLVTRTHHLHSRFGITHIICRISN